MQSFETIARLDPIDKLIAKIIDRAIRDFTGDDPILALDAFLWFGSPGFSGTYGYLFRRTSIWEFLCMYAEECCSENVC